MDKLGGCKLRKQGVKACNMGHADTSIYPRPKTALGRGECSPAASPEVWNQPGLHSSAATLQLCEPRPVTQRLWASTSSEEPCQANMPNF